ncbi:hypothetical protein I6F35_37305 [Bradyrhizobium sp. BRP22]|uniref:hypothetical protein n=1 Tax=Bradyrhizobium sp. BRP22 TaxID=2793821 RepID=UPI001CD55B84|nr:hypothetical protein [Bradyrhizobium sp. BRP22]MCA1458762.1 hypothetical protein [Bradyrhizobium sp. BRP22]
MHSSLAVTTEGFRSDWGQSSSGRTTALKRKINPTRGPIEQKESIRWLENLRRSTDLLAAPGRGPKRRKKIEWKLLHLPAKSRKDAIEKLEWYALRWKIEVFHKILKSSCKMEESNCESLSVWLI